jgi:hypothetical protein
VEAAGAMKIGKITKPVLPIFTAPWETRRQKAWRLVIQNEQLAFFQRQAGIGASVIVRKLDLEHTGVQQLHNGSYLPVAEFAIGQIFRQHHIIQQLDSVSHFLMLWFYVLAIRPYILWQKEPESKGPSTSLACSH